MHFEKQRRKKYKLYKRYQADLWGSLGTTLIPVQMRNDHIDMWNLKGKKRFLRRIHRYSKQILWIEKSKLIRTGKVLKDLSNALKFSDRTRFYKMIKLNKKAKRAKWRGIALARYLFKKKHKSFRRSFIRLSYNPRVLLRNFKKGKKFIKRPKFNYHYVERKFVFYKKRKLTFKAKRYMNNLKLKTFYGSVKKKQLKRLYKESMRYNTFFSQILLSKLEKRLDVILYRLNLFKSIFAVKQFINHKNVYVNKHLVNRCNYEVDLYDIVSIKKKYRKNFINDYILRLKYNYVPINYPKYMEVEYDILSCLIFKNPEVKEIPYPFKININDNSLKSLLYTIKRST